VKPLISILSSDESALGDSFQRIDEGLGKIDYQGPDHPFEFTDYYEKEMGTGIQRRIISLEQLIFPDALVDMKLFTNQVEESLKGPRGRLVNLDAGYLDIHKVVLASGKYGAQKIYLGRGIYADMILRYSRGNFHPHEWCFLDFRRGTFDHELLQIRIRYKEQLRQVFRRRNGE
jgi:hypothetical protein